MPPFFVGGERRQQGIAFSAVGGYAHYGTAKAAIAHYA